MENLNAEQAINELETQIKYEKFTESKVVLLSAKCAQFCLDHAQYYEQRIKELEQCLEHEHASAMEIFGQWSEKCERLTEENERLNAQRYMLYSNGELEMIPTVESVRADTVSNLKARMAIQFGTYTGKDTIPIKELFDVLDKVCEEILDEDHD